MSRVTRSDRRACYIYVSDGLCSSLNIARVIALVYNQNGNADRRVNEKARFEINEIVWRQKVSRKLRRRFLSVGIRLVCVFLFIAGNGREATRDYGGRNEIRCRDALALCKLIIRMQIQSPRMYRLPPDS